MDGSGPRGAWQKGQRESGRGHAGSCPCPGGAGPQGGEAKGAASAAVADALAGGDNLASGGVWAKDEFAKGFESLISAPNKLGQLIGAKGKASPFDVGARTR